MRLPVTPQISTKDGVSAKNARLTNVLKEVRKTGELAVVRPGLSLSTTYAGLGNGLIVFDGRLLVMVDDTIYDPEYVDLLWPLDADEWSADITYAINDVVWYNGDMWFSWEVNFGNAPGSGGWGRWYTFDTWDEETSYHIDDTVLVNGVTYYSYANSNVGKSPETSSFWGTSPAPATRYYGVFGGTTGSTCATRDVAAQSAYDAYPGKSCSSTTYYDGWYVQWRTYTGLTYSGSTWDINGRQYVAQPVDPCGHIVSDGYGVQGYVYSV